MWTQLRADLEALASGASGETLEAFLVVVDRMAELDSSPAPSEIEVVQTTATVTSIPPTSAAPDGLTWSAGSRWRWRGCLDGGISVWTRLAK